MRRAAWGLGRAALAGLRAMPFALRREAIFFVLLAVAAVRPRRVSAARRRMRAAQGRGPGVVGFGRMLRELAWVAADFVALLDRAEPASARLRLEPGSSEEMSSALAEGRGAVVISAHLGSWERLAAVIAEAGFEPTVVARPSTDPRVTGLYEDVRAPRGVRTLYSGHPTTPRAILRDLDRGRPVGFLLDLPTRAPGVPARLLGAELSIPIGPMRVARARGTPVLVATARRSAAGRVVRIQRIRTDDLPPGAQRARRDDAAAGDAELLARVVAELERRIRDYPEGWLGYYVRWPTFAR